MCLIVKVVADGIMRRESAKHGIFGIGISDFQRFIAEFVRIPIGHLD
jgi:hypothetical protein